MSYGRFGVKQPKNKVKKFTSQKIKEFVSRPLFDEKVILNKDPSWPKISIVTPSYNQGEFIEKTMLSVKNQDYPNIEHIIVGIGLRGRLCMVYSLAL